MKTMQWRHDMIQPQSSRTVESPSPQPPGRGHVTTQCGSARGAKAQHLRIEESIQPAAAHLLVAEDDPEMRRFLVESFQEAGYRVTEACNGRELRQRLSGVGHYAEASTPDILISDILLPEYTGLEVLADLRKSDWLLPVILITAFGDDSVHREGTRLGAAMVLDKPFDVDDLVGAVRTLVPAR
jgi:CheY-like chemotaxis protein